MPPACTLLCKLFPCRSHLSSPSGFRQPLTPELSAGFFFVLDVFSILTTTTKSLQLYHFVQAVARPRKAACSVEMVCGQCQQEGEGAVRETGEKYASCRQCLAEPSGREGVVKCCWPVAAASPAQAGPAGRGIVSSLSHLLRNPRTFLHLCVSSSPLFCFSYQLSPQQAGLTEPEAVHSAIS